MARVCVPVYLQLVRKGACSVSTLSFTFTLILLYFLPCTSSSVFIPSTPRKLCLCGVWGRGVGDILIMLSIHCIWFLILLNNLSEGSHYLAGEWRVGGWGGLISNKHCLLTLLVYL